MFEPVSMTITLDTWAWLVVAISLALHFIAAVMMYRDEWRRRRGKRSVQAFREAFCNKRDEVTVSFNGGRVFTSDETKRVLESVERELIDIRKNGTPAPRYRVEGELGHFRLVRCV